MIEIQELTEGDIPEAHKLSVEIFGEDADDEKHSIEKWKEHLKENGVLFGAYDGEQLVGFKFGYQREAGELHSWLAGVSETYRRQGIMRALMKKQETWAQAHGFQAVTVNTYQDKFPAMYILLLNEGYKAVSRSGSGNVKTHFRKDF